MARYLSADELRAAFPGRELALALGVKALRDEAGKEAGYPAITDEQLEPFIEAAETEADAYVATRYALPLPSVPGLLKAVVADMARYRLYGDKPTETVQLRYDQAMNTLRAVSRGTASLGIVSGTNRPVNAPPAVAMKATAPSKVFSQNSLRDW
jgi:phage gp36-like protein